MALSQHADPGNDSEEDLPPSGSAVDMMIAAARAGSTAALGQLMEGCRKYLLLVAHRELDSGLRPKAGASDLVQETFYEAQRDFPRFRGKSEQEFFAWLTGIMNHRLANHVRRYRGTDMRDVDREVPLATDSEMKLLELPAKDATPGILAIARDEEGQLLAALQRLPEPLRNVLVLRTWGRATFVEIGAKMNTSADAARKQWSRAVQWLQQELRRTNDA